MVDMKRFVEHLGYEVLEKLGNRRNQCFVYKVGFNGDICIVKLPGPSFFSAEHVRREAEVLEIMAGNYGIPNLVNFEEIDEFPVLVKEFVPGKIYCPKTHHIEEASSRKLRGTVRKIHNNGLAGLDLGHSSNLVFGLDETLFLIDLGSATFEDEFDDYALFQDSVSRDLNNLRILGL